MLDLPNFSCAETPSKLSRERLRRACKRANSSFPRQLNVELLPTFATVGAVVKLSVRRAEIKRLGIQWVHRKTVPSDDIERVNLRGDFLKTRSVIRALVHRAFV